jgi:hypothetical protein
MYRVCIAAQGAASGSDLFGPIGYPDPGIQLPSHDPNHARGDRVVRALGVDMSDSERFPPPATPEAFESLCLDLWRDIWGDKSAKKNGRSGQSQAGVDVYGRRPDGGWVGVQCKQKDGLLRTKVTVAELEAEVAAAKDGKPGAKRRPARPPFTPALSAFILATTGPCDAKVQERARRYCDAGFEVEVWDWEEIWHELYQRDPLLDRIFAVYWPRLARLTKLPPQRISPSGLPRGAAKLFGRESELIRLEDAWQDPHARVVTLVAMGGAGKSSLIGNWVAGLADRNFDGADYFDWSFYSQGTRDHTTASADIFVDAALHFFGDEETAASGKGPWDKGARLAELVGKRRTLLVLDGLEPLQHGSKSPLAGDLQDQAIKALLRGLAGRNEGLCVVTTRLRLPDLDNFRERGAHEWSLERLSMPASVALLASLGVHGAKADIEKIVTDVRGHALTLNLIGSYLRDAHQGDVRRRDLFRLEEADEENGGHAFAVLAAYERFFEAGGATGQRQLSILRLLGLFDRPASPDVLAALRQPPAIPELTESLIELSDGRWNATLSYLVKSGLIENQNGPVDAHPLIREYFGQQLREHHPEAWRAAHGRLFDYLKDHTEYQPATLAGLQPLYQAVYHGCQSGRHQEACLEVYRDRILRGTSERGFYSLRMLGAFGADLSAAACFFEKRWCRVASYLTEPVQVWLLAIVAFALRAMGRLREAVGPMRAGLPIEIKRLDWQNSAISANNLSELELTLGEVQAALASAQQSISFADRSGDVSLRIGLRTTLAEAQHQAGGNGTALALFCEAERLQADERSEYPLLYSLQGFRYHDLLLAPAELEAARRSGARLPEVEMACVEVERRAQQAIEWEYKIVGAPILDFALHYLSLGRAQFYRALTSEWETSVAVARAKINQAVTGLRAAGTLDQLPRGLLTRAWLRHFEGDLEGACADLDEAEEIAERGEMKLHLADVAIYRARLFDDRSALAKAKDLVEQCGYGRRRAEIEILEGRLG